MTPNDRDDQELTLTGDPTTPRGHALRPKPTDSDRDALRAELVNLPAFQAAAYTRRERFADAVMAVVWPQLSEVRASCDGAWAARNAAKAERDAALAALAEARKSAASVTEIEMEDLELTGAHLFNALQWIRQEATLHYLGDAFDPIHMRTIANMAIAALRGEPFPDYEEAMARARESAREMMTDLGFTLVDGFWVDAETDKTT